MVICTGLCESGGTCSEVYLHRKAAILCQMYEYFLIYMHENWTGAARGGSAVCVHFTLCTCFVDCMLLFSLICTGLAATKAAQSFSESGPESGSSFPERLVGTDLTHIETS